MGFFRKETEADKILKEIKNTQFKRDTILATIENDKMKIVSAKNAKIMAIGQHVYDKAKVGESDFDFAEIMSDIADLDKEIEAIHVKYNSMAERYNEEISILESSMEMYTAPKAQPVAELVAIAPQGKKCFCEQCGKPMNETDLFCGECGAKVQL